MKFKLKNEIPSILAILASIVASFYFFANFPDQVPTHWNFRGEVDDYSSKAFGAFFLPALIFGFYLMFFVLPKIDPRKEKYEKFAKVYNIFKTAIVLVLVLLYFLTGLAGLGHEVPIQKVVPAIIGILFIVLGNYMGKIKSNWFVGIRTPWTLSSEVVWQKTHRLGGWLFVIFGLAMLSNLFFPGHWNLPILIFGVVVVALLPTVYSYLLFRQEKKRQ